MEFSRDTNLIIIFCIIWSIRFGICSQFIRLKELENTIPFETALVEFQTSLQSCLVVCKSEKNCRAIFYTETSQNCGLYTSFDYTKLNQRDNTIFYGQYSTDVALGKPTVQSTMFQDHRLWAADLAVDGSWLTSYNVGYIVCSATALNDYYPWWYVDLMERLRILSLKILTRGDAAGHRLNDVDVLVGDNTTHFGTFCGNYYGPAAEHELVILECAPHTIGRYVKFVKPRQHAHEGDGDSYILSLCEVEITTLEN